MKVKSLSRVRLFATPWTAAYHAPLSMGFSRQEYWSGLPFPFSGDLPDPGIKPGFPTLQADALPSELPGKPYSETVCFLAIQLLEAAYIPWAVASSFFFKLIHFLLKDNCFTEFCCLLSNLNMNQP